MTSTTSSSPSGETRSKSAFPTKLVAGCVAIVLAIVATLALTRPAAVPQSFTPLSGLVTLKAMAAEAVPYETAISSPKPAFIEFYADWCTTCQGMSGTVAQLHEQYGSQVNFVMLDIDDPRWAPQIEAYGASGVPQFTLLDDAHQEIDTLIGKVPKPIFQDLLAQVLVP